MLLLLRTLLLVATTAQGPRGVVVAAHPLAAEAGLAVLDAGGNAADAAAAVAFALSVVEQYSSGIGGGGFATTLFDREPRFLDFREVAPRAASETMFQRDGRAIAELSRDGVLSVAVPGAVAGYLALQAQYGVLDRTAVLAPAIALATDGFPVDEVYRKYVSWRQDVLREDPEASRILFVQGANGPELPPVGWRLVQPDLAWTLTQISTDGAQAFYRGAVASRLVADMASRGGLLTAEDLSSYQVRIRDPLLGSFRGRTVVSSPPPSSGGQILLTLLNVLESLAPGTPWNDGATLHHYIEASKRAFADRALLGDPAHVPYLTRLMPYLIAKDRGRLIAGLIGPTATPASSVPAGQGAHFPPRALLARDGVWRPRESSNTTHLSVVDEDGNAVSMTTTVNYGWGSGVIARGTGMIWNDQMDDFASAPGVPNAYGIVGSRANRVEAGKVPLSSMSPTIVLNPDMSLRLVVGSPGGSRIPTTVAQVILHHLNEGTSLEEAVARGRVHHQHLPDQVFVEPGALSENLLASLRARGHLVEIAEQPWSNATAIAIDGATLVRTGVADPRNVGSAVAQNALPKDR